MPNPLGSSRGCHHPVESELSVSASTAERGLWRGSASCTVTLHLQPWHGYGTLGATRAPGLPKLESGGFDAAAARFHTITGIPQSTASSLSRVGYRARRDTASRRSCMWKRLYRSTLRLGSAAVHRELVTSLSLAVCNTVQQVAKHSKHAVHHELFNARVAGASSRRLRTKHARSGPRLHALVAVPACGVASSACRRGPSVSPSALG